MTEKESRTDDPSAAADVKGSNELTLVDKNPECTTLALRLRDEPSYARRIAVYLGTTVAWKAGVYFSFLALARHGWYKSLLLAWMLL